LEILHHVKKGVKRHQEAPQRRYQKRVAVFSLANQAVAKGTGIKGKNWGRLKDA